MCADTIPTAVTPVADQQLNDRLRRLGSASEDEREEAANVIYANWPISNSEPLAAAQLLAAEELNDPDIDLGLAILGPIMAEMDATWWEEVQTILAVSRKH